MSTYRSQQLLEKYGLIQFINHEFLPENVDIINQMDYEILSNIIDKQIDWEFSRNHLNTIVALLQTMRILTQKYQQPLDLIVADFSILYLTNVSPNIENAQALIPQLLQEITDLSKTHHLNNAQISQLLDQVIHNFPTTAQLSSEGFKKDMLRLVKEYFLKNIH